MTPPRPPISMLMCAPQGGRFTDAKKTHISVLESRRCIFNIELRGCRGDPSQCMMVWVSARFFRSGRERFQQSSIKIPCAHAFCTRWRGAWVTDRAIKSGGRARRARSSTNTQSTWRSKTPAVYTAKSSGSDILVERLLPKRVCSFFLCGQRSTLLRDGAPPHARRARLYPEP